MFEDASWGDMSGKHVRVEVKYNGPPSNYRGKSGGRDGIARSIMWDPKLFDLISTGSRPRLRSWLFGEIRKALDRAVREQDGRAEPGEPPTSGMGAPDLGDGGTSR